MAEVNGLVNSAQRVPRGSELVADAASGATVLFVDSSEDFDNAGGDLNVNGVQYTYLTADVETDTITLSTGLTAAAATSDGVYVVLGGQIAVDHIAYVSMGEGDEAEVVIPYADRQLWPEGDYDPPIPVVLSGDLTSIVSVPGRVPVIDGVTFQTATNGERVIMRNDGSGGIIEAYAGVGEDAPTILDPFIHSPFGLGNGDQPGIRFRSGTVDGPSYYFKRFSQIEMISGPAAVSTGTARTARINMDTETLNISVSDVFLNATGGAITVPVIFANAIGNSLNSVRLPSTIKQGTDTVSIVSNGTPASMTVTFTTPFPANADVPVIQATVRSTTPQLFQISVSGESRSGFTVTMVRTSGAATASFGWAAFSQPS